VVRVAVRVSVRSGFVARFAAVSWRGSGCWFDAEPVRFRVAVRQRFDGWFDGRTSARFGVWFGAGSGAVRRLVRGAVRSWFRQLVRLRFDSWLDGRTGRSTGLRRIKEQTEIRRSGYSKNRKEPRGTKTPGIPGLRRCLT
jgi:hypothetical protein